LKNQSIHFGLIINEQQTIYLRCSKEKTCLNDIDIDSKYLEQVKSYKCLGSIANGGNSFEEEIKERIVWAIKHIMPVKIYLKANYCQRKLNLSYIGP
jgi:hypothetical protein